MALIFFLTKEIGKSLEIVFACVKSTKFCYFFLGKLANFWISLNWGQKERKKEKKEKKLLLYFLGN
jgi:hypothetical protein